MIKITGLIIGMIIVIHFTLYYCNLDPFHLYKPLHVEISHDFGDLKNNLEDCLNELKQYDTNMNNESYTQS